MEDTAMTQDRNLLYFLAIDVVDRKVNTSKTIQYDSDDTMN